MNFFLRLLLGNRTADLTENQYKALLDILICVMLADGKQESTELEELTQTIKRLNLDQEKAIESYVNLRKREFLEHFDPRKIFAHAAEVLNEPWMREHAYQLAAKFASSDNEVHAGETEALHHLIVALDIPREKVRVITQRLIQDGDI